MTISVGNNNLTFKNVGDLTLQDILNQPVRVDFDRQLVRKGALVDDLIIGAGTNIGSVKHHAGAAKDNLVAMGGALKLMVGGGILLPVWQQAEDVITAGKMTKEAIKASLNEAFERLVLENPGNAVELKARWKDIDNFFDSRDYTAESWRAICAGMKAFATEGKLLAVHLAHMGKDSIDALVELLGAVFVDIGQAIGGAAHNLAVKVKHGAEDIHAAVNQAREKIRQEARDIEASLGRGIIRVQAAAEHATREVRDLKADIKREFKEEWAEAKAEHTSIALADYYAHRIEAKREEMVERIVAKVEKEAAECRSDFDATSAEWHAVKERVKMRAHQALDDASADIHSLGRKLDRKFDNAEVALEAMGQDIDRALDRAGSRVKAEIQNGIGHVRVFFAGLKYEIKDEFREEKAELKAKVHHLEDKAHRIKHRVKDNIEGILRDAEDFTWRVLT